MHHTHERWMKCALDLGEKALFHSAPNPWVGCVLVKDFKVVGEGFTQPPGGNHAEIEAIKNSNGNAKDATAYVTLEPCCHHGRTPPCVDAIIRAGISSVIVATEDPDPRVSGHGIAQLRAAGIVVEVGVLGKEARQSLGPYIHQRTTGRAYCLAKAAVTIDGRMAAADGTSQWISGESARADTHRLRAESQAVMVGIGTAIKDWPSLNVRNFQCETLRQPLRVVLDSQGRLPAEGPLFDTSLASTLIFTSDHCSPDALARWKDAGVEVQVVPSIADRLDLKEVLTALGSRGILQVLVEGGPTLLGSLWKQSLIDQLILYIGPRILGDKGLPLFAGLDIASIAQAPILTLRGSQVLGDTIRADYSKRFV